MLDVNETFIAYESRYDMPYHELESIVAFVLNFEREDLPEGIKDHLEKWQDFLVENL
jgi:hypothetical protein